MIARPVLSLLALLLAAGTCQADPLTLSTRTSLPRQTTLDGQSLAWRHLIVQVETPMLAMEVKLPFCLDAAPDATLPARLTPTAAPARCTGLAETGTGSSALSQVNRQWKLVAPLPSPWAHGPQFEASLSGWHAVEHQASPDRGTALEVSLSQPLGDVEVSASLTEPLGAQRRQDGWRTAYVGISWTPSARHAFDLFYDHARALSDGERDRQATLRYTFGSGEHARWRVFATRHLDDSAEPWESGLSVDWAF